MELSIADKWYVWCLLLGIVFIALFPIAKRLLWWLFRFDSKVQDILSQKKSSEVKVAKIAEVMAPLLSDFPVNVNKPGTTTCFLGQPVDFVHFDPQDGITFIEVKSGDARQTVKQKALRSLVERGKVSWSEYRVKG